jgi:hypothetical protein
MNQVSEHPPRVIAVSHWALGTAVKLSAARPAADGGGAVSEANSFRIAAASAEPRAEPRAEPIAEAKPAPFPAAIGFDASLIVGGCVGDGASGGAGAAAGVRDVGNRGCSRDASALSI